MARALLGWGTLFGLYWDNGKENGNYYNGLYRDYRDYIGIILLGFYGDNGKENGSYYKDYIGVLLGLFILG